MHFVPENLPERIQHYIDGEFVDSVDGDTFDVLDPVSNETYVHAAAGKKADIDLAVAAAKRAFDEGPWPRMLPRERSRVLHRIADHRRVARRRARRAGDLRHRPADHPGARPGPARRRELPVLRRPRSSPSPTTPIKVPGAQINYVNRKPIGVAGLITPWNTPFMLESLEARPRAGHRQHRRAEAGRVHAAVGRRCGPESSRRPACRRACSTS